jgi:hypothetical protein
MEHSTASTEDKRGKIQALSLAKECYCMKLKLLTNATVVDDDISFIAEHSYKYKESKEIGVNSDDEYVKIKQQEVSKGNINNAITNNRVFSSDDVTK